MAQFGRPSADTLLGNFKDQADGTTNIYTTIDESSPSDADYIKSPSAPSSEVYVTALSSLEDPVSSSGHTVRVRHQKSASGGADVTITAQLRQGYVNEGSQGTLICTALNAVTMSDTATTTTYNLSAGEADSITNYGDLALRVVVNQV